MKTSVAVIALLSLNACIVIDADRRGPPAHAPAHGARAKAAPALQFDRALGVQIVVGQPGFYFHDRYYWRFIDGFWHRSVVLDGPWLIINDDRHVPPGLLKKHPHKHKEKGGKGKEKSREY
jgi:hypothetical protein